MSIRVGDKHVVAPSGVQKERMAASDLFVLDPQGNVLEQPETRPPPYKAPKLSECYPLFQQVSAPLIFVKLGQYFDSTESNYCILVNALCCSLLFSVLRGDSKVLQAFNLRDAGAVMHSHSVNAVLATLLDEGSEFRVTNLEMIKVLFWLCCWQMHLRPFVQPRYDRQVYYTQGIQGHGYYDTLCIPIIENTARECELTASLREAIIKYPKTSAVLVRRHGVYVWGKDWIQAKTQVSPEPAVQAELLTCLQQVVSMNSTLESASLTWFLGSPHLPLIPGLTLRRQSATTTCLRLQSG